MITERAGVDQRAALDGDRLDGAGKELKSKTLAKERLNASRSLGLAVLATERRRKRRSFPRRSSRRAVEAHGQLHLRADGVP